MIRGISPGCSWKPTLLPSNCRSAKNALPMTTMMVQTLRNAVNTPSFPHYCLLARRVSHQPLGEHSPTVPRIAVAPRFESPVRLGGDW